MTEHPMRRVVDALDHLATGDGVTVGDGVQRFGAAGFETLVFVPAILMVSPLSGIPLFTTICGMLILLVAAQGALGRDQIWLPARVMRLQVSAPQMQRAARSLRWIADMLDRITRQRVLHLVSRPARRGLLALCAPVAIACPLLEFIPFSSSVLGGAVALFALALLARDGMFVIMGFVVLG